ncbi:unnamed protein product [Cyberlindnera jadinii]|uniref:Peptidase A1 domain-containing protein n=1 Tax=Cyberlindnera jadinii (strain ATCC 18201 / CBS 1600 / BCRC 20928 / JCM 3617 / NBRC 0987 / NRRL Y-1542) TaxID=983966 RepID=A0A0H5BZ25_CYBJN|nr:unnamed protein product [Cyberlindnera jadinii]
MLWLLAVVLHIVFIVPACTAKNTQGYQFLPFKVSRGDTYESSTRGAQARLVKREGPDGTVIMVLENQSSFYSVDLQLGSNNQSVIVLVDTGSSDLWVMGSDNVYCSPGTTTSDRKKMLKKRYRQLSDSEIIHELGLDHQGKYRQLNDSSFLESLTHELDTSLFDGSVNKANAGTRSSSSRDSRATIDCSEYGTFDSSSSTSFVSNNTEFFILYGDSTFAYGTWGYDNVVIDGLEVSGLSFAVANETNSSIGVLGIGLEGLETTYSGSLAGSNRYTYSNLPMKMVEDGLIHKRAYSLYLNDVDAEEGNIIFGGVDHAKYTGNLTSVPVINTLESSGYSEAIKLEITLQDVSFDGTSVLDSVEYALLDSGTTLTYLPSSVVSALADQIGATYSSRYGYYIMDCPDDTGNQNITFTFDGTQIACPLSNFILAADTSGTTCVFSIMSSDTVILGDSFLRSGYIVYDLDDLVIALAQVKFTDETDIEVITSSIPNAVTATGYSSTAATNDNGATVGVLGSVSTSTSESNSDSGSSSSSSNRSSGASGLATPLTMVMVGFVVSLSFMV